MHEYSESTGLASRGPLRERGPPGSPAAGLWTGWVTCCGALDRLGHLRRGSVPVGSPAAGLWTGWVTCGGALYRLGHLLSVCAFGCY